MQGAQFIVLLGVIFAGIVALYLYVWICPYLAGRRVSILNSRCRFCGGTDSLRVVVQQGYVDEVFYYHLDCLKRTLCSPQTYGHTLADVAIEIEQCIQLEQKFLGEKKRLVEEACARIHTTERP